MKNGKTVIMQPLHIAPIDEEMSVELMEYCASRNGGVHIGTAGFVNFDIGKNASSIVLFDINENQEIFWNSVIKSLKTARTRFEFVKILSSQFSDTEFRSPGGKYAKNPWLNDFLLDELNRHDGWLGSDESFRKIKVLANADRISAYTMDIMDSNAWADLGQQLRQDSATTMFICLTFLNLPVCHFMTYR